jgi:hypothetical protein
VRKRLKTKELSFVRVQKECKRVRKNVERKGVGGGIVRKRDLGCEGQSQQEERPGFPPHQNGSFSKQRVAGKAFCSFLN